MILLWIALFLIGYFALIYGLQFLNETAATWRKLKKLVE